MKSTIFARINGTAIKGEDILRGVKRLLAEYEDTDSFALTPNGDNQAFLYAEALQKLIERQALLKMAAFEGIEAEEEVVNRSLFELRDNCQDEAEWESLLHDMNLEDYQLREELIKDITIDNLLFSRLQHVEEPDDEAAEAFYHRNKESMILPDIFSFIEVEAPSQGKLQEAALILNAQETAMILNEAERLGFRCVLSDNIPKNQLPEPLQAALSDLEPGKIGSLPADDGTIILIKLLSKVPGKILSLEDALPGLKEYLAMMQQKALMDALIEEALEKCDIEYLNAKLLKDL